MQTEKQTKTCAILPHCDIRAMEGIISSLGKRGIPLVGLSSNPKCIAFYSKYLTQKLVSPDPKEEAHFIKYLMDEVPRGVLLTSNDQTAVLFARHEEKLRAQGFLLNVPPLEKLLEGFDKLQCYTNAKRLGVPTAETIMIASREEAWAAAERLGFPHIIKPTRLAGGNYIRINSSADVVPAFQKMLELVKRPENRVMGANLIAQRWLNYKVDDIWCVESYYDTQGQACGFWPVRKWRTVIYKDGTYGSRLYAGECLEQSDLADLSRRLLYGLEWRGFAHLDWVYLPQEKTFCLTEINPRLPGFSLFPSRSGFEMAYYYYADLVGEGFVVPPMKSAAYFEIFRNPGDVSSTLVACLRKQYSFKKFVTSYWREFFSRRPFIVDYFERQDPVRTVRHILRTFSSYVVDFFKLIRR
ncbi:MAG: hypothetical protein ACLFV2_02165 [Desulfurivibrionaceae bacterium]